jgi:cell division protein FtsZ
LGVNLTEGLGGSKSWRRAAICYWKHENRKMLDRTKMVFITAGMGGGTGTGGAAQ